MKIRKIHLKNFKRFTDLTIAEIPATAKLVLTIGSNGSGKSSLFDAFAWIAQGVTKPKPYNLEESLNYYRKDVDLSESAILEVDGAKTIYKEGNDLIEGRDLVRGFIGRSSVRIVPHITREANVRSVPSDLDAPKTFIENDIRFLTDVYLYIQQINNALREPVFSGRQADTLKIFRDFIEPLNNSLLRIFGGDETTTIQIAEFQDASNDSTAKLIFKKGTSKINYDLLSHGEKQIIILLINFIVGQEYYKNAIIYIDEMDCHLNTALQYNLLHEIVTNWIPDDSQLWTASHALGFIDYAKKSAKASIIDFDLLNFDSKQIIVPQVKDNIDVYEIAIPKSTIASILKGYKLVIVENQNDEYFNEALGPEGYLFLPANNNREVFLTVKSDPEKLGLRDRDYLRIDEIEQIREKLPKYKVLTFYTFENYLYHPDNLAELNLPGYNKAEYIAEITKCKNTGLLDIVAEIGISRSHYIEFKDCIKNDLNLKPIIEALKSNDFDEYYAYFNMKKHYDKFYLSRFNYTKIALVKTNWFKTQILKQLIEK